MKEVLSFMNENPWFSFFVILITLQTVVYVAKYLSYAIRGGPRPKGDDDIL
jgi:hypothetical protein